MADWIEALDWTCLDALLSVTAIAAAAGVPQQAAASVRPADISGTHLVPRWLPAGALSTTMACHLLVQSVEALQWTSSEAGGDLVQLLRCLQQLWHQFLADEQLQVGKQLLCWQSAAPLATS
jgi:hypothetical protein